MKTKRGMALATLLVLLLAATSLGLSQTNNGGTGNTGSGNGASSNAGAQAIINNNQAPGHAGFISAAPGVGITAVPGYAPEDGVCYVYWPAIMRVLTMEAIRSLASGAKYKEGPDFNWAAAFTNKPNNDPIELVPYNSESNNTWIGDAFLGSVKIRGKYGYTPEQTLAVALLKAKEKTQTRRVAVVGCSSTELDTKAGGWGLGFSGAYTPPSGTYASAVTMGISRGTSRTGREEHLVLHVIAMNDWPTDTPHAAPPAQEAPPPSPQAPAQPAQQAAPQPAPAQQAPPVSSASPQTAPPSSPPQPQQQAPAPVAAQAPPPTAPAPSQALESLASSNSCSICGTIPEFTIYFLYNSYEIDPKYDEGIRVMAQWLKDHPSCKVQVQGHASKEASKDYNYVLGNHRAEAVYNRLISYGAPPDPNGLNYASPGKVFPRGEYGEQNRRVILVIQGPASGR